MQHSELQELVPLYALGGMSASESAQVAQHLAVCASCRALLNEYRFVADEMLSQVPPLTAPAYLGTRLQNLAGADAQKARPVVPSAHKVGDAQAPRFWNQPLALPRWVLAFALLTLLLLLGAVGTLAFQLQQNNIAQQKMLQLLTSNRIKYIELTGNGGAPDNRGFLCVNKDNTNALLWLHSLTPLDSDHVYQVWLRKGNIRDNGGTFRVDYNGRAMVLIQAPRPLTEYSEIGITVEPATGSPYPNSPRVVGGKLD